MKRTFSERLILGISRLIRKIAQSIKAKGDPKS
jgi:hypothetical protein